MGEVAMITTGEGPPAVLVHGLNGFKEGWGPLPRALADAGMSAVMLDLPGSGASPRPPSTTPDHLADAVVAMIDRLAGPVSLVGHSLGTQVAMIAATARPAAVRRLSLVSPWVFARPRRFPPRAVSDALQIPLVGRPLARLVIRYMRRDPHRRRAAYTTAVADLPGLTRDPAMADLLAEASDRLEDADVCAMADWAASALALDVRPLASRLAPPTLVVIGGHDRITRPPGAAWLAHALPAGRLLHLDGVGHFPHLEAADRVLPALVEHLR